MDHRIPWDSMGHVSMGSPMTFPVGFVALSWITGIYSWWFMYHRIPWDPMGHVSKGSPMTFPVGFVVFSWIMGPVPRLPIKFFNSQTGD